MAANTYVALVTQTIGTATNIVDFNSIPQGYTDLELVFSGALSGTGSSIRFQFNGDTATNYSSTRLWGNGSLMGVDRNTSQPYIYPGNTGTAQSNMISKFMNYSNSTTFKTNLARNNTGNDAPWVSVGLWRSTAAITSIRCDSGGRNMIAGSTLTLYGIASQETSAKATGGIVISDSTYYYHTFLASGTFTAKQSLSCDMLVIAGGGGAGQSYGGAGGGGGYQLLTSQSLSATGYTVTVGAGGAGSTGFGPGSKGGNSQFGALTASNGGGYGGYFASTTGLPGGDGGSGGGGAKTGGWQNGGAATPAGQGNPGGGANTFANSTGGGGGAGSAGGLAGNNIGGSAGNGLQGFTGLSSTYYSGGGAGVPNGSAGTQGGTSINTSGIANTGAGAGAEGNYAGGSGIVIVRYAK